MLPKPFPNEPSLDVRQLLAERGIDGLAELMRERSGYVPRDRQMKDLAEAIGCGRPLLCKGAPGCGKTAFGKALRYALNVPRFYLQCHEDLKSEDILYYWADKGGTHTRENLVLCDPLAAYDYCVTAGVAPVLHVDELDKTNRGQEYQLLEVFEERQATVPNLTPYNVVGIPEGSDHLGPVVIVTANEERELSEPMESRCIGTYFRIPTPAEEVAILRSRVPAVSERLLGEFVKMMHVIRHTCNVERKPGIRESVSFLGSVVRKGVTRIDWAVIDAHLGHIAKNEGDADNIYLKRQVLEDSVGLAHDEIDLHVALAFATPNLQTQEYAPAQ
jgi:MoxR-like ATPase